MDWPSVLVGAVIGVIITIFAYEYEHWRERMTETSNRKRQAAYLLQSELNKVIMSWEAFKKTEEMHVDPGLQNFQYELEAIACSLRNMASVSEALVSRDMLGKIIEIANSLTKLSQMKFYINGGRSWNTFLELGDKVVEQSKELSKKLT